MYIDDYYRLNIYAFKEERNRKKYDEGVHKGHRYTNVDDLKSD